MYTEEFNLGTGVVIIVALLCAMAGLLLHAYAGWWDQGRIVLRPGGHVIVFAAFAWIATIILSGIAALTTKRWRFLTFTCLAVGLIGLALLF
jgi:hypothetical protein